ncbi:MAG: hypothetical protein WHX53_16600, partial [Anaerolineae bacterium]
PAAARPDQIAILVIFGLAALYARRIVPWYGMALAPTLALAASLLPFPVRENAHAAADEKGRGARPCAPTMNYVVLAIMAFFLIVMSPWVRPYVPAPFSRSYVVEDYTPDGATQRLCALGPTIRAFINIHFASYMTWACPSVPIFMDTRFELYPATMWRDYIRIMNGLYDWEERLTRYGVDVLFVQKESEFELIAAAKASGRWDTLYEDTYAIIMRRRAAP